MSAPLSADCRTSSPNGGVGVMLVGVAIAVAAQLWPGVPLAGAVALIAWGTVSTVMHRASLLVLAAIIYAPLGVLVVMAQVDLAMRTDSVAWASLAGLDAAMAITLLTKLAQRTGELLARGCAQDRN